MSATSPRPEPVARVSEHDRDYFRRLGQWEAENERTAWEELERMSLDERLARSCRLMQNARGRSASNRDHDDPAAFYESAVKVGAYRR